MLKLLSLFIKLFIILLILGMGIAYFVIYHYSKDLPDYSQLNNYHPSSITRIYSSDGKLIEEYSQEYRVFVPITSIPTSLINAFVAAEDKNFFTHQGVDITSIIRAAIANFQNIFNKNKMQGGSTITQQVVKNFLLSPERSLDRKIKEAILSYMISRVFTKQQILELYLNQSYLGMRAYGVAMAAQNYFNKSVDELNLQESAFIAGLPKAPSNFDPIKNYNRAKERRDYVISRMLEDGYITNEAAKEAIASPIDLKKRDSSEVVEAGYYAEHVREEAISMIGSNAFYNGGFSIITSLNTGVQNAAREALLKGIRGYDARKGYRGTLGTIDIVNWQQCLKNFKSPDNLLEYKLAVVLDVSTTKVKIGLIDGSINQINVSEMKWAINDLKTPKNLLKKGDVIVTEQLKNGFGLRQIPEVNGAILVMNPHTGQVLAAQGGYNFAVSKFDRTTQALRQPGSLIKTFIYLTALENDILPNSIFDDAPIAIPQGPGMPIWSPKNYKGDFLGQVTMRSGLEKSRNLVTIRVATTVGLGKVSEMIRRFGINNSPKKVPSMVLGSLETTLYKMASAYSTIANYGHKVTPQFIELIKDRNGKIVYQRGNGNQEYKVSDEDLKKATPPILESNNTEVIIDEATDYQIISMLTGVIERGTAIAAKKLGKIIAGKTGTTNDSKDAWFIGFTPRILVGTYIGYDTPKDMGKRASGSTIALPVFINFMENYCYNIPSLPFKVPESIKLESIDPKTGLIATGSNTIIEAFKIAPTEDIRKNQLEQQKEEENNDVFKALPNEKGQPTEVY